MNGSFNTILFDLFHTKSLTLKEQKIRNFTFQNCAILLLYREPYSVRGVPRHILRCSRPRCSLQVNKTFFLILYKKNYLLVTILSFFLNLLLFAFFNFNFKLLDFYCCKYNSLNSSRQSLLYYFFLQNFLNLPIFELGIWKI